MRINNYRLRFIDSIRKTSIVDKYKQFFKISHVDYDRIIVEQIEKLTNLLLILKKNKFFNRFLSKYDISAITANPLAILKTLPLTDKDFIRKNYEDLFNPIYTDDYQKKRTGGTSGTPFIYFVDKESISHSWAFTYFFWHKYAGYNPGDNFATIAGNSLHSTRSKFQEKIYYLIQNNYFISSDVISDDFSFNESKAKKAKLIYGYPTTINQLLYSIPNFPRFFPNVKAIFTTSELLLPNLRKKIENSFGVKVFDIYGANDGGMLSSECEMHNGYHYNMLNCFAESIVNSDGESEIYLTNLNSFSFPFVRYRVGDLGRIDFSRCECGFPMSKIVDLKGRTRDLIYLKGRGFIHGSYFNSLMQQFPQITLYRIIQNKDFSINIYIKIDDESIYYDLANKFRRRFSKLFPGSKFTIKKLDSCYSCRNKFKVIESVDKI